jgi:hypothetical protein
MKESEVFGRLCIRDKRNPMHLDIYGDCEADEIPPVREDCFCDNCFYGRDRLALEIIEKGKILPELLKAVRQALEIFDGEWPNDDEIMGPVMKEYQALINKAKEV